MKILHFILGAAALGAAYLRADVIETTDGARLVGKVTGLTAGTVTLDTHYAGTLTIKQSDVASIQTDHPVSVRLASGTRIDGTISVAPAAAPGALQVAGADGTITTTVGKVAAVWPAGGTDPAIAALQRHWDYEITSDVAGTSGNKSSLSTGASIKAEMATTNDDLKYYAAYNRAVAEGVKSADQFKAGVDYADNFTETSSWFIRDEGGFDRIQDERFFDTAAFGYGAAVVKTAEDLLTARVGLGYRYQGYYTESVPTISSAAGDLELAHSFKDPVWGEISNNLTFVPDLNQFSNFVLTQDSYYQIPLANPHLKLRIGVSNNYVSQPSPGFKRLDTLYYTRLVFDWGTTPQ
jgi:putative salt-induced outer membrane protein YdiY